MKQLENQITLENNDVATLVKRTDKAAIYKRESSTGEFISFEVFAIMTKDGMEIYPNKTAFGRGPLTWAWCPILEDRANVYYDRLNNGDVVIPQVDPVTGEVISDNTTEVSLDEMPDVNVDTPTIATETTVDPTIPEVTAPPVPPTEPTVQTTPDGGAVVTVAKVRKTKVYPTMKLPVGEFIRDEFAELNGFDHHPSHSDSYVPLMREIKEGRVREVRKEKRGPGRPRSVYIAITQPATT